MRGMKVTVCRRVVLAGIWVLVVVALSRVTTIASGTGAVPPGRVILRVTDTNGLPVSEASVNIADEDGETPYGLVDGATDAGGLTTDCCGRVEIRTTRVLWLSHEHWLLFWIIPIRQSARSGVCVRVSALGFHEEYMPLKDVLGGSREVAVVLERIAP